MSSDLEFEPIPGLPEELPPGERVVWSGRPNWKALARNTFRVHWLAVYFLVFVTTKLGLAIAHHDVITAATFVPVLLAVVCLGVLCLMAWLHARATVYTVTSRRVVLRIGVAIPTTWNLPFARLASADLLVRGDGDGDIVMNLKEPDKVAWIHLWPHTQPWNFSRARPTLRTIDDPRHVAGLLSRSIREWSAASGAATVLSSALPIGEAAEIDKAGLVMGGKLMEAGQ
jgi:hypothetical protein